jgi:hypothetical protein
MNIDYALLAWQRAKLAEVIENLYGTPEDRDALEGIQNLLDALADQAIKDGLTTEVEQEQPVTPNGWEV